MRDLIADNYAAVTYPQGSWNLQGMHSVEVLGNQGEHEIAIITYGYPRSDSVIPPEKTQVVITYGRKPGGLRTFYGYVNHHESEGDRGAGTIHLICIGSSLPLNSSNPASWTNVSASYIARTVAQRYQLRPVLTRTREIIPHWAQGPETDFQMLGRLAKRAGVNFWVSGASLFFVDPTTLLAKPQLTPTLTLNGAPTDSLLKVAAIAGSLAPGNGAAVNYVYGLSTSGGLGHLVKASSIRATKNAGMTLGSYTNVLDASVVSGAEAQHIANAHTNVGNWVTVEAQINSDQPIAIGDVVTLDGTRCPGPFTGQWVVSGFDEKHVFLSHNDEVRSSRTSVLTLTRNQQYNHTFNSPGLFEGVAPVTPAISVGGQWQASQQGVIYV